jgi:hypothetical protein
MGCNALSSSENQLIVGGQKATREIGMKTEAKCTSETYIAFHQITRRCAPEDGTLHAYPCQNIDPTVGRMFFPRQSREYPVTSYYCAKPTLHVTCSYRVTCVV